MLLDTVSILPFQQSGLLKPVGGTITPDVEMTSVAASYRRGRTAGITAATAGRLSVGDITVALCCRSADDHAVSNEHPSATASTKALDVYDPVMQIDPLERRI